MLRLKVLGPDEDYPADTCAAVRCQQEAVIVDATQFLSTTHVPLCEYHWQVRCELESEELIVEIVVRESGSKRQPQRRAVRRPKDDRQLDLPLMHATVSSQNLRK